MRQLLICTHCGKMRSSPYSTLGHVLVCSKCWEPILKTRTKLSRRIYLKNKQMGWQPDRDNTFYEYRELDLSYT